VSDTEDTTASEPDAAEEDAAEPDNAEQSDTGSDEGATGETNALLSRLRLIEDQPLEIRAAAFAQVNDELQARLEGGDIPRQHA
jgi:hypothetical protein